MGSGCHPQTGVMSAPEREKGFGRRGYVSSAWGRHDDVLWWPPLNKNFPDSILQLMRFVSWVLQAWTAIPIRRNTYSARDTVSA